MLTLLLPLCAIGRPSPGPCWGTVTLQGLAGIVAAHTGGPPAAAGRSGRGLAARTPPPAGPASAACGTWPRNDTQGPDKQDIKILWKQHYYMGTFFYFHSLLCFALRFFKFSIKMSILSNWEVVLLISDATPLEAYAIVESLLYGLNSLVARPGQIRKTSRHVKLYTWTVTVLLNICCKID